jgi:hypothetical protein
VGLERLIFRRPSLPSSVQTGADLAPVPDCGTMTDEHRWALGHRMSDRGEVSRKLVAVFAAGVEGYSLLMGADEVGTLRGSSSDPR